MTALPVVYPGVHLVQIAKTVPRCMISANRLLDRRSDFEVTEWIMDAARYEGRNPNSADECLRWLDAVESIVPDSSTQTALW